MKSKVVSIEPFVTPYDTVSKSIENGDMIQIENGGGIRYKSEAVMNIVKDNFDNHMIQLTSMGPVVEDPDKSFFNINVYTVVESEDDPDGKWAVKSHTMYID